MGLTLIACLLLFLIPISSALIPADNIDNKSYMAEPNTNTNGFDPENHEIFEPETTQKTPSIIQNSDRSSSSSGSGYYNPEYYDSDRNRNKTIIEPAPEPIATISNANNSPQKTAITPTTTQKATGFSGLIGLVALLMIAMRQKVKWH